jgi:hypothetical protein
MVVATVCFRSSGTMAADLFSLKSDIRWWPMFIQRSSCIAVEVLDAAFCSFIKG